MSRYHSGSQRFSERPRSAQTVLSYNLFDGNDLNVGGEGVYTHTHPIAGAADFVNPLAGDYRIRLTSAARDAGDPAGVPPAPDYDADGTQRPFGAGVDIGAYEWHGPVRYLPLVTHNTWAPPACGGRSLPLARTTDGGTAWPTVGPELSTDDMSRVVAVTADVGWAAGDYGVAQPTLNGHGGQARPAPVNADLYGLSLAGARR